MRLAQLARKIAIKPIEIVDFLSVNNIVIEGSSNAKITDEHVLMVMKHFAPELLKSDEAPVAEMAEDEGKIELPAESIDSELIVSGEVELPESTNEQEPSSSHEVIKPPKVELPGLKVVGKIDLPEPIKKEEKLQEDRDGKIEKEESPEVQRSTTRSSRSGNGRVARPNRAYDLRLRKNPIALQREREEREALRKKLEQQEKEKELRTQRYLKKVSTKGSPSKPIKRMRSEEEYETYSEEVAKPKSFIGKILNWFVSE